jgi:hypothetical protein
MICAGALTYDVTIRDLSEGGVKLKLGAPFAVPPTFLLMILNPNTGVTENRACETRWQRGDQVGAQFVAALPDRPVTRLAPASLRRTDNAQ